MHRFDDFPCKGSLMVKRDSTDHLLMGYPVIESECLKKIGLTNKQGNLITLMIDDPRHMDILESIGKELKVAFNVCVDIDVSVDFGPLHFGVWRSPLTDEKKLDHFLKKLNNTAHINLVGLMGYEAQYSGCR